MSLIFKCIITKLTLSYKEELKSCTIWRSKMPVLAMFRDYNGSEAGFARQHVKKMLMKW